jgi:peptidoglycan-associated lipoprotein
MRRRILVLLASGASLGMLAGCPPTYPKCNSDDNCKDHNEVCVEGQCQECAGDANCKAGFSCQNHKCVPKAECQKDADCGQGMKCQNGKCTNHCDSDKDCASGSKCISNQCVVGGCNTNEDCPTGQECVGGTCQAKAEATCNWDAVHFDFNESSLTSEAQSRLQAVADCIKKEHKKVRLEGHADERGTEEYNLHLSQKRAASVKKYLVDLGVPAKELDTVGYGKTRPAVEGHDEAAWAANRRVEFNRR